MRKNSTRKNGLARVSSRLGDELLRGVRSPFSFSLLALLVSRYLIRSASGFDASTLVVASPIYRQRPWASSQILSGKGANIWPIRRGTSGTLILTKVGLRPPKAVW